MVSRIQLRPIFRAEFFYLLQIKLEIIWLRSNTLYLAEW
nr:MAG TPA: hypothetical protein [Caudoviricetes sp.]